MRSIITLTNARLLRPAEVAEVFGVAVATVTRWVHEGRLPAVRTPGGHHRYRSADVDRLLAQATERNLDRADAGSSGRMAG